VGEPDQKRTRVCLMPEPQQAQRKFQPNYANGMDARLRAIEFFLMRGGTQRDAISGASPQIEAPLVLPPEVEPIPSLVTEALIEFDPVDGHNHDGTDSAVVTSVNELGYPAAAAGDAGKVLRLNTGETALEFTRQLQKYRSENSATLIGQDDEVVLCDGTFNVTLPDASDAGFPGRGFFVKNIGSGTVTLSPPIGVNIDAGASLALAANEGAFILSDGTDWWALCRA
jgi:hypothetical protein